MSLKSNGNPVRFEAGKFLPAPPSNGGNGQGSRSSGNGGNGANGRNVGLKVGKELVLKPGSDCEVGL